VYLQEENEQVTENMLSLATLKSTLSTAVMHCLHLMKRFVIVPHRIIWSWYTTRWWVGCYISYSEEGDWHLSLLYRRDSSPSVNGQCSSHRIALQGEEKLNVPTRKRDICVQPEYFTPNFPCLFRTYLYKYV